MRIGKPLLITAFALVVVAGGYSAYWFYTKNVALDRIAEWVSARQLDGFRIGHEPPRVDGYPFSIRIVLGAPSVVAPGDAWHWQGTSLALEAQPWNLYRYRLESHGAQEIGFMLDGEPVRLALETAETTAVAGFWTNGQLKSVSILLRELKGSGDSGAWQAAEVWIEVTQPETPPVVHTETALTLSVSGAEVTLPEGHDAPLGRTIESLRGDFRLLGAIDGGPIEAALNTWRQAGGTVEVPWLRTVWNRVDLRAQGTLALDEDWRPAGSFSADIRGFAQGMDALAAANVIEPNSVTMAKIGLALLAKKPPEGGEAVLTVPITAQAGQLFVGPIRIARLPPIQF